jgi:NADPH-dependent 2,4-dienoyl-CoA reductase/sulfur reductase-like enzyme/nitrite reductase/ring-hydroxylating ferredoxin subunit
MGSNTELTGPDLRAGVALAALREDEPFAGHVDGQSAMLVRKGNEVFALGATCTHWSGPLAEGLVTGEQIRCPWHHACFSLRTGEVLAAPALSPLLPRWATSVRDGKVFVGEALPEDHAPAQVTNPPSSVVIIGAGAAGMLAAETLRQEGYQGDVALIDPDADAPYDRPNPNLSKDFLAGNAPEEWLQLRSPEFYREQRIDRMVAAVAAIDAAARTVRLADGRQLPFGGLLLATGAAPIRLPIPGVDHAHVHVLRSRADCQRLIAALSDQPRIVIAGASFIGLEAAAALKQRGADVTVVAPEQIPFARVLGPQVGRVLQQRHEQHGVRFLLGRTLQRIDPRHVELDNGELLQADLVLLGVGVRPNLALAEQAGLRVDNGVLVDEYLETSVPGIYAAGDIARFPDARTGEPTRIEHWVVAERQGRTAARNMLGRRERFTSVPFFWTSQHDVTVAYVGHASHWDDARVDGDVAQLDCAISYLEGGRPLAVATINRDLAALRAEVAFEADTAVSAEA